MRKYQCEIQIYDAYTYYIKNYQYGGFNLIDFIIAFHVKLSKQCMHKNDIKVGIYTIVLASSIGLFRKIV